MFEIDKKKFGAFVSELRREKGYTQKELAEKLEKDENFFVKINWLWYIGS